jgi:N-acetylglutamate synthase
MWDTEAIERATLAAVPPQRLEVCEGWLLGLDDGTVGRAHSAVPLRHEAPADALVRVIEARYAAAGLRPCLRVPQGPAFDDLRERLRAAGYVARKPTLVQVAELPLPVTSDAQVALATSADAPWEALFLGEGFDPVDGASRLGILRRSRESLFASVRREGRAVAVGAACFSHGWCGVHGMRTAPAARRQGLAAAILHAFAREARVRGLARMFLQVERENVAAQSVYARLGFTTAWSYAYWQKP